MKEEQAKKKNGWLEFFIVLGIVWKIAKLFFRCKKARQIEKNFKSYLKDEEKEIRKYEHSKESLEEFLSDSESIFKDYFIPYRGNGHKPKILHTRSLAILVLFLFAAKVFVAGYIFYSGFYQARMSENISAQILDRINKDRVAQNLGALDLNSALSASAFNKAEDMLAKDYFAHYTPDGKKPWDFIDRASYPYVFVGENLAMNFSSADSAHQALMLSPTHKANIMNEKYADIGIAVVNGDLNGKNTNVLVQLFAVKKSVAEAVPLKPEKSIVPEKSIARAAPAPVTAPSSAIAKEEAKTLPKEAVSTAKNPSTLAPQLPVKQQAGSETLANDPTPLNEKKGLEETAGLPALPAEPTEEMLPMAPIGGQLPTAADVNSGSLGETAKIAFVKGEESPNLDLENNLISAVKSFENIPDKDFIERDSRIRFANTMVMAVLALLFLILLVNIIIKHEIQHRPIIAQTLFAIVLLGGIAYYNFGFLENILPKLFIV